MKNNFELYDSIKAMLNVPKAKAEPLAGLSEASLAAYAKKGPNSPISGQYQSVPTIAETVAEITTEAAPIVEDVELSEEELQAIADNITEEEFEQLDELSKKTLSSYVSKATKDVENRAKYKSELSSAHKAVQDAKWGVENAAKHGDSGKDSRDGFKDASYKMSQHISKASDHNDDKIYNRKAGQKTALKKLTKEDVEVTFSEAEINALLEMEQLDELSKATLQSYVAKNSLDPSRIKKRGPTPKDKAARLEKRDKGHFTASNKIAAYHKKELDAKMAEHAERVHHASEHFMKTAHEHLTSKGYTHHGEHKHEGALYSKYHAHNGVLNTFKVKRADPKDSLSAGASINHTAIQGHSYRGNSTHHSRVGIFHDDTPDHKAIGHGVHDYINDSEKSSHDEAASDHKWKDR